MKMNKAIVRKHRNCTGRSAKVLDPPAKLSVAGIVWCSAFQAHIGVRNLTTVKA